MDGSQLPAQHCQIIMFQKGVLGFLRLDLLHMGISVFRSAVFQKELGGGFLPYAWKAGNVVGRIPHQRFQFYDLWRGKLISRFHIFGVIIFNGSLSSLCLGDPDTGMVCGQLKQVPVTGKDGHIHFLGLAFSGQGSQNIICLIAFPGYNIHAHSRQHVFHDRHLLSQFPGHRLSGPFICVIHLMAEGRCRQIKSYCKVIGILLLQHLK